MRKALLVIAAIALGFTLIGIPWYAALFSPWFALISVIGVLFMFFSTLSFLNHVAKRPFHVLVADDDSISITPLLTALSHHNIVVDFVSSGAEAIHKLAKRPFELVFLDYSMPDFNGMDVLKECEQTLSSHKKIPVVFYTYFSNSIARPRMRHFDIKGIWSKDVSFKKLDSQISGLISSLETA